MLRHGVDMYKQTINLKNQSKTEGKSEDVVFEKRSKVSKNSGEFYKVTKSSKKKRPSQPTPVESSEPKIRRVAKFLILIGSDQAAEILAELDPEQVNEISKEIALINIIKPEERDEIFAEFRSLFSTPFRYSGSSHGGIETARRILYAALGPAKGEELLNRTIPESKENIFGFLQEFSPEQIVALLKTETAQTMALILSRLPPKLSAGALSILPPKNKPEVLRRMAHQREISPQVLEQITAALKEKTRHIRGNANEIKIDGMQTLAAILKHGDMAFGDKIINEIEQESPDVGKNLKEKFFTLDDVIAAIDRPIQEKLSLMTERQIAVLLKGQKLEFCEKILSCVSSGRRKLIREESEILGDVPKRDCDEAADEFLSWFRRARKSGEVILYSDKDVFL